MSTDSKRNITWDKLIEMRLAARKCQLRPASLTIEGIVLMNEARWLAERGVKPPAMTLEDHEAYLAHRVDQGRAGCTRRRDTFAFRGLLAFGRERGYLRHNVLEGFTLPKADEPYVYVPDGAELSRILDYLHERANPKRHPQLIYKDRAELRYHRLRNRALIITLIDSMARIGEVLGVEMPNVDLMRRQMAFVDTKTHTSRTVPISPETVEAINAYLRVRPESTSPRLFLTEYGQPIEVNSFSQTFKRIVRGALPGKNITLHSIRHYGITEMARADLFAAMQKAGHKDLKVTQGYLKRDPEHVRRVSEQVSTASRVIAGQRTNRKRRV